MFGFKKKPYDERFKAYVEKDKLIDAACIARDAFDDKKSDEHLLAWLVGAIYEIELTVCYDLMAEFIRRYPESLHPIQIYYADKKVRDGHLDRGSYEARQYLRRLNEAGLFEDLSKTDILQTGVARGFLLATSVFTEMGAKGFSQDVLNMALDLDWDSTHSLALQGEVKRIEKELSSETVAKRNSLWTEFFLSGDHMMELIQLCERANCPILADYVELWEGKFRFDPTGGGL